VSRCKYLPVAFTVSEEFHLAQELFGMHDSLAAVAKQAVSEYDRNITQMYRDYQEVCRGKKAREAGSGEAAGGASAREQGHDAAGREGEPSHR
jgi:hypothetical protein